MAKFCGKCGTMLDEQTGKCPHCEENRTGENISQKSGAHSQLPKERTDTTGKGKNEKHTNGSQVNKKHICTAWILFAFVILLIGALIITAYVKHSNISTGEPEINTRHKLLNGSFTELAVMDESSALEAAKEAAYILNLGNAADELTLEKSTTVDNVTYYRFQQSFKGVPVYGRTATLIADKAGKVKGFSSNMVPVAEDFDVNNALSDETVCLAVSRYYGASETDITITRNVMVVYGTLSPELCHKVGVQIGETSFAEVIVSVKEQTVVDFGLLPNPETCVSAGGIEFNGSKDKDGKYVLMDLDDNFYCFTANGEVTYSYEKQTWINNSIVSICSEQPVFYNAYESAFVYAEKMKDISDYYTEMFSDEGTGHFALIMDSGTGTTGGLVPIEVSADLKEICTDSDEIGVVQIGAEDDNVSFCTLAHEYTHVITNNQVRWKSGVDSKNEAQVINEAYSDLFGMIINQAVNPDGFMWDDGRTDVSKPSKENYPIKVNKYDAFLYEDGVVKGSSGQKVKVMWVKETNQAYTYTYAVTLEYAAYLMSRDYSKKGLTIDELAELWYKTMLTLPSDCNFVTLRNNMEMTASVMGLSKDKIKCISKAFDKIDVRSNECLSTDFSIWVYNKDLALCSDYVVTIDGKANVLLGGMIKKNYHYKQTVTEAESSNFRLPEGEYTITVTDGINSYFQEVTVKKDGENKQLTFIADFEQCNTPIEEDDTPTSSQMALIQEDIHDTDENINQSIRYAYDSRGLLQSKTIWKYNSDYNMWDAQETTSYSYNGFGLLIQEIWYNNRTNKITDYKYDEDGNLTEKSYGSQNELEESCVYTYDENGRLKSTVTKWYGDGNEVLWEEAEEFFYDVNGRCTHSVIDGTEGFGSFYTYDTNGNLIKEENRCGESSSEWTHTYNEKNQCIFSVLSALAGTSKTEYTYTYDDNGNKTTCITEYSYLAAYGGPHIERTVYSYDYIQTSSQDGLWKQSYRKYIEEEQQGAPEETFYYLTDMNGDNIPELLVDSGIYSEGMKLCTFDGKNVNSVNLRGWGSVSYIEEYGLVCNSSGHHGMFEDEIYQIADGQITTVIAGSWTEPVDMGGYVWDGENVSKEDYEVKLNATFPENLAISLGSARANENSVPRLGSNEYSWQQILSLLSEP